MEMKARIEIGINWAVGKVNLNELVYRVDEMKDELLAALVGFLISEYQEVVVARLVDEHVPTERRGLGRHHRKGNAGRFCHGRKCIRYGSRSDGRCFKTKFGEVRMDLQKVKCSVCGAVYCPVLDALGIAPYGRHDDVLEKTVLDAVVDTNYRRLIEGHGIDISLGSVHNFVVGSDISEQVDGEVKLGKLKGIMADGTGLKTAGGKRGELRALVGITHSGALEPLGCWVDTSWQEIEQDLKARIHEKPDQLPLFVYDGEPALDQFLADHVQGHQRCTWHAPRGLYHAMWEDGHGKKESEPLQDDLARIVAIEIPEGEYDYLTPEVRQEVERQYHESRNELDALIGVLENTNCVNATAYLRNLAKDLYHQVECWLTTGVAAPRTTSRLERTFRELGRRLKRIAWGWSDKGATNLSKMILVKKYQPEKWKEYWLKKMGIEGNFSISLLAIIPVPPNTF